MASNFWSMCDLFRQVGIHCCFSSIPVFSVHNLLIPIIINNAYWLRPQNCTLSLLLSIISYSTTLWWYVCMYMTYSNIVNVITTHQCWRILWLRYGPTTMAEIHKYIKQHENRPTTTSYTNIRNYWLIYTYVRMYIHTFWSLLKEVVPRNVPVCYNMTAEYLMIIST